MMKMFKNLFVTVFGIIVFIATGVGALSLVERIGHISGRNPITTGDIALSIVLGIVAVIVLCFTLSYTFTYTAKWCNND